MAVVAHGMGLDERIGRSFLQAGIGFGGSCFPKDVAALKQLAGNSGYHFQLLTSVIEVNELQKRRVIGKLKKHLGSLEGKRWLCSAWPSSPRQTTCARRRASCWPRACWQGAEVCAYDPVVDGAAERLHGVIMCTSAEQAISGADAAVLVTEWASIVGLDWEALRSTMLPRPDRRAKRLDPDAMAARATRSRASAESPHDRLMQAVVLVGGAGTACGPPATRAPSR